MLWRKINNMIKLAFFDVDGTLSAPQYMVNGKLQIGMTDAQWLEYCAAHGEDTYEYCKPVKVVKDPELRQSQAGKSVCSFSGAVKRRFAKEGDTDTDWFQFTAFGATADFISKYFKKGSKILVEGTLQNNNYDGEKNGQKISYRTDKIIVDNVEFYGKKEDGAVAPNTSNNASSNSAPAANTSAPKANSAPAGVESYDAYDDF